MVACVNLKGSQLSKFNTCCQIKGITLIVVMEIYFLHSPSRQTITSVPRIFLYFHIQVLPFIIGNYICFDSICLGPEISYNKEKRLLNPTNHTSNYKQILL